MTMSETPDQKKIDRVVKRMRPEQFSELCAELGLIETELGADRAAQVKALIRWQTSSSNPQRLVRTIRHVWPEAFDEPLPRPKREIKIPIGPLVGGIALLAIVAAAALIVINALNPAGSAPIDFRPTIVPVASQPAALLLARTATYTPTPTDTFTPTPTSTPDYPATLTATYAPTATPTRTPTRTPRPTATGGRPTAATSPTPAATVKPIYPQVRLLKPPSNSTVDSRILIELRWFIPGFNELNPDERFRLRLWQNDKVVFEELTHNNWHDWFGGPNGQLGTYQWSVAVVKVDANIKAIDVIGPESERWTITWK